MLESFDHSRLIILHTKKLRQHGNLLKHQAATNDSTRVFFEAYLANMLKANRVDISQATSLPAKQNQGNK